MICPQSISISTIDLARQDSESEAPAHRKNSNGSFADALARYATPPFSPWPPVMPLRDDTARVTDPSITTRPADQRRERRQRSRG